MGKGGHLLVVLAATGVVALQRMASIGTGCGWGVGLISSLVKHFS